MSFDVKRFNPDGMVTGIGSLPHLDPVEAVRSVTSRLSECPFWPQLPKKSVLEGMTPQYSTGFPGLVETGEDSCYVDTGERGLKELETFYGAALAGEEEGFGLNEERAAGWRPFLEALSNGSAAQAMLIKGHITGPVTLATSLKDPEGREIVNDDSFREAVALFCGKKAGWQAGKLQTFGKPALIFMDEPVMEIYGSAFSTLNREMVLELWAPSIVAIRDAGAVSAIHCCGNTDWGLLFDAGVDVVNFDAYHFLEKMLLYPERLNPFLASGGMLAWGIVPTSEEAEGETVESLMAKLADGVDRMEGAGVDAELLRRRSILTPSCGMGGLEVELSEKILDLLIGLSSKYREKFILKG